MVKGDVAQAPAEGLGQTSALDIGPGVEDKAVTPHAKRSETPLTDPIP
jgi:hypothetical protein